MNSIWSSQFSYRVGVLQWTPTNDSHFTSGFNLAGVGAQRAIVLPALNRLGNRTCFGIGALISAVSYFMQSQAHRPFGASKQRMAVQYIIAMILLQTVPAAMSEAMRAMVVKQGITVSDVGKAEINAAFSGLGDMINIIGAPTSYPHNSSLRITSCRSLIPRRFAEVERLLVGFPEHYDGLDAEMMDFC